MRLIRGLHNLRDQDHGCVATIGNFDGVHLGHQAVFRRLLAQGQALGLPATVITFEPQPMEYFAPAMAPARLTRLREKVTAIANTGVARVLLLEFGAKLAQMPARDFIEQVLVAGLGVRYLLVGDDFRFGHNRAGDYQLLEQVGRELGPPTAASGASASTGSGSGSGRSGNGFAVENLRTIKHNDERISSTRIRELLAGGDFEQAAHLLGRAYRICGRVAHGDRRGRTIGYPTANINLHRRVSPLRGVYAVQVHGIADSPWPGVANIGRRPTVAGTDERLEVHLFNLDRDLYGAHLEVEFRLRLRDELRFESFDALKQQIARDANAARQWLLSP
ncbi:bifunctional riboflavin kinase/FAD synthetase [Halochromatium glycolicum]|uniref:Riboflavin biosynthesis protein n=1 Tax=Halochromatium glycolicum TaxID=85075 RepID=A0AAJ0U8X3_9GAMM|nr:bifunctional riboflavin kinase/FAD synthetase [Halochromatium glycolicum]MBK1707353.1 bifunctional riboflavin kinase/FMN adenylyltransferase [Halochromatium glycolicum]